MGYVRVGVLGGPNFRVARSRRRIMSRRSDNRLGTWPGELLSGCLAYAFETGGLLLVGHCGNRLSTAKSSERGQLGVQMFGLALRGAGE